MANPLREGYKRGKRCEKGVGNFWGEERYTREKRETTKKGKLSTINLVSSREAHGQGKRKLIGLGTSGLGPLGWLSEVFLLSEIPYPSKQVNWKPDPKIHIVFWAWHYISQVFN